MYKLINNECLPVNNLVTPCLYALNCIHCPDPLPPQTSSSGNKLKLALGFLLFSSVIIQFISVCKSSKSSCALRKPCSRRFSLLKKCLCSYFCEETTPSNPLSPCHFSLPPRDYFSPLDYCSVLNDLPSCNPPSQNLNRVSNSPNNPYCARRISPFSEGCSFKRPDNTAFLP